PTTWDETLVPDASVDEYVTIARRNGTAWYIGTINNTEARQLQLSFAFFPPGTNSAEIYEDTAETNQQPTTMTKHVRTVTYSDVITVNLAAGGGHVVRLTKR